LLFNQSAGRTLVGQLGNEVQDRKTRRAPFVRCHLKQFLLASLLQQRSSVAPLPDQLALLFKSFGGCGLVVHNEGLWYKSYVLPRTDSSSPSQLIYIDDLPPPVFLHWDADLLRYV
jgi:hypothetical protein